MPADSRSRATPVRLRLTRVAWLGVTLASLKLGFLASETRADSPSPRWRLFAPISTPVVDTQPHPAVVRVVVDEGRMTSNGSGTLVAARDQHGLVVTNWHVIRDAKGAIEVIFPNGYRSVATVLKTDQDWDLAALLIWRPDVTPLAISTVAPQPGDSLTIAGYGQGEYRAVAGKCTQYVSPSMKHPYEIVEVSAEARQGDSGGPILNDQNELAGVLFGSSRGSTSGSYCGRVRWFLSAVWPELEHEAQRVPSQSHPFVGFPSEPPVGNPPPIPAAPLVPINPNETVSSSSRSDDFARDERAEFPASHSPDPSPVYTTLPSLSAPMTNSQWNWSTVVGTSRFDQAKSVLAVLGLLALWGNLSRWLR